MKSNRTYFPNLDILRFLAALWVVVTHYGYIGPNLERTGFSVPESPLTDFFRAGFLGVCIFFVLSGFLMAHVTRNANALRFGLGRIVRLMPGFWACLTVSALLLLFFGSDQNVSLGLWLANSTLLPQAFGFEFLDGAYWTLVYEFVFYGWVTALMFVGIFHKHMLIIVAVWLAISFANILFLDLGVLERLFVTYFAGAFGGGLILWHGKANGWSVKHGLLMIACLLSLAFGIEFLGTQNFPRVAPSVPPLWLCLCGAVFSLGVVAAGIYMPSLKRGTKFASLLGAISYPLYLIHQELGYALLSIQSQWMSHWAAAISVGSFMVLLAYVVHRVFEEPLRALLTRAKEPLAHFVESGLSRLKGIFGPQANVSRA